jgi:hypothetical protein
LGKRATVEFLGIQDMRNETFISTILNQKIKNIKSCYEDNKCVIHQGVKGSLNELLLKELVTSLLPKKYKAIKGIVQDYQGNQSSESDIVLTNTEILPSFLFGNEIGFVPAESVEYWFEIKSKLNNTEIKDIVKKSEKINKLFGYKGRNVLFGFDTDLRNKTELERYSKEDKKFYKSPSIQIITVLNNCYFFFHKEKRFLKNSVSKDEFTKMIHKQNTDIKMNMEDGIKLKIENKDCNFKIDGKLIINDIDYELISYDIYRWYGAEYNDQNNDEMLGLLTGIVNTLSNNYFGNYILKGKNNLKAYSEVFIDMWGNESYKNINFSSGINMKKEFDFFLSLNKGKNKLTFTEK